MFRFKKFLTSTILIYLNIICFITYSQVDVIPQLKPYEDIKTKLYTSKVIELPNKSQKDLITQFKNWGSTNFANFKEVVVSETENQIVLVYTQDVPIVYYGGFLYGNLIDNYSMYIRLLAEFKEGKMRVSIYDDGNVFRPSTGSYGTRSYEPAKQPRTIFISNYQEPPLTTKDFVKFPYYWYLGHVKWEKKCDDTILSLENGMKNPNSSNTLRKDDF